MPELASTHPFVRPLGFLALLLPAPSLHFSRFFLSKQTLRFYAKVSFALLFRCSHACEGTRRRGMDGDAKLCHFLAVRVEKQNHDERYLDVSGV